MTITDESTSSPVDGLKMTHSSFKVTANLEMSLNRWQKNRSNPHLASDVIHSFAKDQITEKPKVKEVI